MNYAYPDVGDKCDRQYYERYGAAKWWLEERWVIDQTLRFLSSRFTEKSTLMLDVGCGQGRLLPAFCPLFERIIGIEPDANRFAASAEFVFDVGATEVVLLRGRVPEVELEPADFILCSHVLQHLPTVDLLPFLSDRKSVV